MTTKSFQDQIMEYAQGNPGALRFLMKTFADPKTDLLNALSISNKLQRCPSIRGTNLYVLYSDLGNGDIEMVADICDVVPDDVLEDACSRQDYSGRELIRQYIMSEKED